MKKRVRGKKIGRRVFGLPERPRLSVSFSLSHIRAQVIDDFHGRTLAYASTEALKEPVEQKEQKRSSRKSVEMAKKIGGQIAELALAKGIKQVVFDRAHRRYHGRVSCLADAAREGGLQF